LAQAKRAKRKNTLLNEEAHTYKPTKKDKIRAILRKRLKIEAKTENQRLFMDAIKDPSVEFVIGSGIAGCGKTFLALVEALNLLQDDKNHYDEIMIFKSITPLKGEDIGALPGTVDEKLLFIYQSFFMQLEKLIPADELKKLYDEKIVRVMPLGTIRGISIPANTIVIVDEVQNLTSEKVHAAKTRIAEGSKMILIGDESQCDTKEWEDNGLTYLTDCYTNVHPAIEVISFTNEDSVRNPLIQLFQRTHDNYKAKLAKKKTETQNKRMVL
jgi:phosphate starvation-inducible PhoH-like protein